MKLHRGLYFDYQSKAHPSVILDLYNVHLLPFAEQSKIAAFLSSVDDKITQLSRKRDLLAAYKRGAAEAIFSQKIRFKDDDGNEFPEWKRMRFGEAFNLLGNNSLSRDCLVATGGMIRNIHYGDIHTKFRPLFRVENETVPFIRPECEPSKSAGDSFCRVGDLVIADASEDYEDIGKAIEIISLASAKVVAGLHTIIARPTTPDIIFPSFNAYLMRSEGVRLQIKKLATGISVLGISKYNIAKVELPFPSRPEQEKISRLLSSIDDKIANAESQLEAAKRYKSGLLQQMFVH